MRSLTRYLEKAGKSERHFAVQCKVAPPHMHRILRGTASPSIPLLVRMADESGLTVDQLAREHVRERA